MAIEKYLVASDQELVAMSSQGDNTAFGYLMERYRGALYRLYVHRLEGTGGDAEDLIQDIAIKIYLNLDKYNPRYTFGQWVYTIARNTYIDYMRRHRDRMFLDRVPENYTGPDSGAPVLSPEENFIKNQQYSQIEFFMDKMTPRYRTLIELRFFKDYSYEEIAQELGIPMGTVKTQIHRAREQLCRFITNESDILK